MSNINELEKEVGLLREKVELLRALEELKARGPVKEYIPYPNYPYGPYPSPWWGVYLTPIRTDITWTTGGTTSIGSDIKCGVITYDGTEAYDGNRA